MLHKKHENGEMGKQPKAAPTRLPGCSVPGDIAGETPPAKVEITGWFRPSRGELVHLQAPTYHRRVGVSRSARDWAHLRVALKPLKVAQFKAIPIGFREGGEAGSTRGGLCVLLSKVLPFERGTVPVQCPYSARTVPATVPVWNSHSARRFSILKKKSASTILSFKMKN